MCQGYWEHSLKYLSRPSVLSFCVYITDWAVAPCRDFFIRRPVKKVKNYDLRKNESREEKVMLFSSEV